MSDIVSKEKREEIAKQCLKDDLEQAPCLLDTWEKTSEYVRESYRKEADQILSLIIAEDQTVELLSEEEIIEVENKLMKKRRWPLVSKVSPSEMEIIKAQADLMRKPKDGYKWVKMLIAPKKESS